MDFFYQFQYQVQEDDPRWEYGALDVHCPAHENRDVYGAKFRRGELPEYFECPKRSYWYRPRVVEGDQQHEWYPLRENGANRLRRIPESVLGCRTAVSGMREWESRLGWWTPRPELRSYIFFVVSNGASSHGVW